MSPGKDGITVIICTYNGAKNLPETLTHLAQQNIDKDISWEVILVNNGSTDNTKEIALGVWKRLSSNVPFIVRDETQPGKDKAMDTGLQTARYNYVIICDDDNWLDHKYVESAFFIMKKNPQIGMLGGIGIPIFQSSEPKWFDQHKIYYAVGKQNFVSGEIKHYWPEYRFVWGAGAVINMHAYRLLLSKGFSRILTYKEVGTIARSEDLELSFALWLAGFKLWFDKELVYRHYISDEKLEWSNFIKVVRCSVSAIHYLRPYQILIFTGCENSPDKSYWFQYMTHYLKVFFQHFRTFKAFKTLVRIILNLHQENEYYFNKLIVLSQFYSVWRLGKRYDKFFKKIVELQKKIVSDSN